MRRCAFWALAIVAACVPSFAQTDSTSIPRSENGWYLSPHGTIRILVLFAEIEYDKTPAKDPQRDGSENWQKGQLPKWKDDLFDPFPKPIPTAMLSRYYHDISLGDYIVLGDYVDQMLTLKESEYPEVKSARSVGNVAVKEANKLGELRTKHRLKIEDFDLWQDGGKAGLAKVNLPDAPHKYDHVMVIARNSGLTHGQGSTDQGSPGKLFGYESDTQSRFGGMNGLPFEILKHEYNHLLLGGNNFHSGGGNASQFEGYFIPLQGGWSMMGAASSSLLTCSAWDRDRLGWKAEGAPNRVNAKDTQGRWVNGDLDPTLGDTGLFVLRDMVTTGDALRIRMPFLGTDEFPQWIWLENHLGWKRNGSPTDRFHYEQEMSCVQGITPGVFAMVQVDRDTKSGADIFGGKADYLRALPAGGLFDIALRGDTVGYGCLWGGKTQPVILDQDAKNPLTGSSELELPVLDQNGDGILHRGKEGIMVRVDVREGKAREEHRFFGHRDQAFTPSGNNKIGMATNPALANAITLASTPGKDTFRSGKPNDRVVHLAGISVTFKEQRSDGSMLVHVRNDDTFIDRDTRWCADSIVLHAVKGHFGFALYLGERKTLTIDRSRTATRIDRPEQADGYTYFCGTTKLTLEDGARMHLAGGARLHVIHASEVHLMPRSRLELDPSAKLVIDRSSRIVVHGDARLEASKKMLRKLQRKRRLVRVP